MKVVYIPTLPNPKTNDLRITLTIGESFKRTEILKKTKWAPGQAYYVDPDTRSVEFSAGQQTSKIIISGDPVEKEGGGYYQRASKKF